MKSVLRWSVVLFLAAVSVAQTQTATGTAPKRKIARPAAVTANDVQELKDALAAQQQQIEQLRRQLAQRDQAWLQTQQQLQQAQSAATAAQARADQAAQEAGQQQQAVSDLKTDMTDMKQNAANAALSLQETQKNIRSELESPLALHYKGITITPGGFLAAETVWRQHALGADINTPFNSIPFDGASAAHMSEFFGSGRQSRISMLAEGKLKSAKVSGYVEADFLSSGISSNNNQSNSYSLRQRQAWGQAALNDGWSFTGGQMWSLLTETKNGLDNRTEALPMTIDPQYNVGFTWARQYGFRITRNFSNKAWFGFSVENPQTTTGGTLVSGQNNFIIGSQGAGGGLYNATANYSFNATPDFVTKLAFQPGWGHFEVFGVIRDFRDRIFPCGGLIVAKNGALPATTTCNGANFPNAVGASNNSSVGGGGGANLRVTVAKHVDVGVHFMGGDGIGRYGSAGLADVVVRPDGVLVPARNYQALGTLEWHSKRLDIYANVGGEYEERVDFVVNGKGAGYGSPLFNNSGCYTEAPPTSTVINVDTPGSGTTPINSGTVPNPGSAGTPLSAGFNPAGPPNCAGNTRAIYEGTLGFWYRLYSGDKGRVQFGPQYSYINRSTWAAKGGTPSAQENMILTSFRYYLP
ncbi:MAG TPA: hypothetical protein VEI26_12360 [Terriglobales bacterium]|nr:hypothetical protein [Terriglobales bacterium]